MSQQRGMKPSTAGQAKRRILLIDDDPLIRHLVHRTMEPDYIVDEAETGTEGITIALTHPPDLILLDVMMPGMDGYEVCYHLRQNPTTATVPIIMLTALDQMDSKVHGLRTGADDYMTKPFDTRELRTRVETHLRRSIRDLSSSPLTGLAGNPVIEQVITERIMQRTPLAILYIDLTNFKAYNDQYGWIKGDQVIKMLAMAITDAVSEFGTPTDFVGHVGGDDFIVVSQPDPAGKIAQSVIDRFDAAIPGFYDVETRTRGYSIVKDRRGQSFQAPIATVGIAIVTNTHHDLENLMQVADLAAQVKRYVKSKPGSHYAFDRRQK